MKKTSISFGLVNIPVEINPIIKNNDISFNQLHKKCLTRIKYVKYCPHCKKSVSQSDIIRGYEFRKNDYVTLTNEEFNKLKTEDEKTIEIIGFVNLSEIDHTERNTGSGWTLEEKLDKYTYTSSNNSSFRTVDKAGNVSDEIKLNIRIEKDPDKNMSAKCNIVCGPNGRNCYVYGQNYGASWQWTFTGAGSGINPWSMYIDYSTEWVTSYCQLYYPTNKNYCGNAEWGSNWILFGRSYARSHITGTACSYKGKCKSCTVY